MILLPTTRQRITSQPFLFRAHACLDEIGLYALSYGQKVYATFTRAGGGTVVDQNGRLVTVPNGAPRIVQLYTGGARVPALLLESQVDNLCAAPSDFADAAWTKSACTVTSNVATAPDGTLTGDLLTASSTSGLASQTVAFSANSRKSVKVFLKEFSSSALPQILLYDSSVPADRHRVTVTWVAGVPVLSTISGGGFLFTPRPAAFGWWEVEIAADGVLSANTNQVVIYPDRAIGTGGVYVWQAQAENAGTPGSAVAVQQLAEVCSWPFLMPPAALSVLYAGVEIGLRVQAQLAADSYHLWTITSAADANPKLRMNCFSGNGRYQFQRTLAAGTQMTAGLGDPSQPDPFEAFEMRGTLYGDGHVEAGLRAASESAESVGVNATPAALEAAWGGQLLCFNQQGTSAQRWRTATRAFCLATGAKTADELHDLCELG